ncbi:MAG TPA: hypothetical protein K8U78_00475 [Aeriscardovia aeriphila]|uniref:Uncharacterized protein n=1 Tax=Aeriscardovia aeriphila TaxID=218139 RepID=A0A921KA99_9BIFI|nr:hypothetical protein [Aeriscardovia aeriphila]
MPGFDSFASLAFLVIAIVAVLAMAPLAYFQHQMKTRRDRAIESSGKLNSVNLTRELDEQARERKTWEDTMSEAAAGRLSDSYIASVRAARKASIRRRRYLVAGLLALTLAVGFGAFVAHYNAAFVLIPLALLAVVLGLGARASQIARAWEAQVAEQRSRLAGEQRVGKAVTRNSAQAARGELSAGERAEQSKSSDEPQTDVMSAAEIFKLTSADRARAQMKAQMKAQQKAQSKAPAEAPSEALSLPVKSQKVVAKATKPSTAEQRKIEESVTPSVSMAQVLGVLDKTH